MAGAARTFDIIIVGAGSAGCVLAHRLSADPQRRVLLLEAGGSHKKFHMTMPLAFLRAMFNLDLDVELLQRAGADARWTASCGCRAVACSAAPPR